MYLPSVSVSAVTEDIRMLVVELFTAAIENPLPENVTTPDEYDAVTPFAE